MNDEMSWLDRADEGENHGAAERYQYFMRPEPREDLGPIKEINDEYFGPKTKVREMSVGMVRNAKEENKKRVLVFLHPFPHTRIDTAKPLQGWYKSLHEQEGVRPRPCFTEAVLTEPYGGFCAVGCSFCLPGGELVDILGGSVPIESLKKGDLVWGRSKAGAYLTQILEVAKRVRSEVLAIELEDGRVIKCTPDHPIWSDSRKAWINAEDIKAGEKLQDLRKGFEKRKENFLRQGVLAGSKQKEEKSSKVLSRLRKGSSNKLPSSLRWMQLKYQGKEREFAERKASTISKEAQVKSYSFEDESLRSSSSEGNVSTCKRAKVSRMEKESSGESQTGSVWIPSIKTTSLYRQKGQDIQNEVNLGGLSSEVYGRTEMELGLRTHNPSVEKRIQLPTRLHSNRDQNHNRSEGVFPREGQAENSRSEGARVQGSIVRSEGNGKTGNPIVKEVKRIQGEVQVYDIQTETENFYTQGILVHNCYINSGFRGYRGTGLITVPLNYGEQIKKQLSKMVLSAAGYFSSFTDPFTPLEAYYHNTEKSAEEFVKLGLPIFFLSRLRYPDWAVKLLTQNKHSYAQKSINTCNADDWQKLSPGALPLKQHFSDITRLKKRGIYISIQVNPILPGITSHEQVETLFKQLKNAGADHVIVKFVEAGYSWAPAMTERTIKRFGEERGRVFESLFTENIGGQRTICEEYRLPAHERYAAAAKKLGLTYATCYEYKKERDSSGKVINSTGVSIGRDFTTAEQCHGQRVPMYQRQSTSEQFTPMEACPPSGCLYCASENNNKPRCGDEELGQAKAMRTADYKKPILLQLGNNNA